MFTNVWFSLSVVMGKISSSKHHEDLEKTSLQIDVSRIVRQKDDLFGYHHEDRTTRGLVYAPRKCNFNKGPHEFLLTGKLYLGHPTVTCSPYLDDWRQILKKAIADGTMECSLNWTWMTLSTLHIYLVQSNTRNGRVHWKG